MESKQDRQRRAQREWYERNKNKQKDWVNSRRKKLTRWFQDLKANLSCIKCGESHPACLDFHHRNPEEKSLEVGAAINEMGWGIDRVKQEIAKCDVLCSNCHRKEHYLPLSEQSSKL